MADFAALMQHLSDLGPKVDSLKAERDSLKEQLATAHAQLAAVPNEQPQVDAADAAVQAIAGKL